MLTFFLPKDILLACGHVFCDTCTAHRRIVPWIDTEKAVRVCNNCHGNPKPRPPTSISNSSSSLSDKDKQYSQGTKNSGYETGSSGDSTSTVSSGEHLSDLCLTPTDIFDIEQPGAGMQRDRFILRLLVSLIPLPLLCFYFNAPFVHAVPFKKTLFIRSFYTLIDLFFCLTKVLLQWIFLQLDVSMKLC